jgi:hypothetical protein|tara:strand:+ start:8703 stop:9302 length:600 start_codon:yes stop_codon:yes gene_type:complete
MQSNNKNDHIGTVVDVISTCIDEEISVEDLTMNDIEYLMVKLRTTSVGETVTMRATCEKCEAPKAIEIDLTDFYVKGESKDGDRIHLADNIGLIMQLPRLRTTRKFAAMTTDKMKIDDQFSVIETAIAGVYDDKQTYRLRDQDPEENRRFIESMTTEHMESITNWISDAPRMCKDITWTCDECGHENRITVEGLSDFFT